MTLQVPYPTTVRTDQTIASCLIMRYRREDPSRSDRLLESHFSTRSITRLRCVCHPTSDNSVYPSHPFTLCMSAASTMQTNTRLRPRKCPVGYVMAGSSGGSTLSRDWKVHPAHSPCAEVSGLLEELAPCPRPCSCTYSDRIKCFHQNVIYEHCFGRGPCR